MHLSIRPLESRIFLDASVPEAKEVAIVDGRLAGAAAAIAACRPDVEVHVLDAGADGVTQVSRILEASGPVDAVPLVATAARGGSSSGRP